MHISCPYPAAFFHFSFHLCYPILTKPQSTYHPTKKWKKNDETNMTSATITLFTLLLCCTLLPSPLFRICLDCKLLMVGLFSTLGDPNLLVTNYYNNIGIRVYYTGDDNDDDDDDDNNNDSESLKLFLWNSDGVLIRSPRLTCYSTNYSSKVIQ